MAVSRPLFCAFDGSETRTYLINGFVAGKPQNLHNENRRNVKIWLSSYSFTSEVVSFPQRASIYEMASSIRMPASVEERVSIFSAPFHLEACSVLRGETGAV